MQRFRAIVKGTAEAAAASSRAHRIGLLVRRSRASVLAYHNVVPDELAGMGDASLHLPVSAFRRQLEALCAGFRPVPLGELLGRARDGHDDRLPVAITFDDAYRGTLEVALPELVKRGIPSTVFVAPALLGDQTLWWDALAAGGTDAPGPDLRSRVLAEGKGKPAAAREIGVASGARWEEMPELLRTSTEAELAAAAARGDCTIGSHTWSHPSLMALGPPAVEEELSRSRAWLRERFGETCVDVVSYPYGHRSAAVDAAAEACGYGAALGLAGGSFRHEGTERPFLLPRMNVPAGLSVNGLKMRLGWR